MGTCRECDKLWVDKDILIPTLSLNHGSFLQTQS